MGQAKPPDRLDDPVIPAEFAPEELRAPESLKPFRFQRVSVPEPAGEEDELLLKDIRAAGIKVPLMVTADGQVFNGRARLRHARTLGLTQVPVQGLLTPLTDLEIEILAGGLALTKRYLLPAQRFDLLWAGANLPQEANDAAARPRGRPRKRGLTTVSLFPSKNQKGKRTDEVVGTLIGAGATTAFQLQTLHDQAPELYQRALQGGLSVDAAYRELRSSRIMKGRSRMPPEVPDTLEVQIPATLFDLSRQFKRWPRRDQELWLGLLGDLDEDLRTAIREHERSHASRTAGPPNG